MVFLNVTIHLYSLNFFLLRIFFSYIKYICFAFFSLVDTMQLIISSRGF